MIDVMVDMPLELQSWLTFSAAYKMSGNQRKGEMSLSAGRTDSCFRTPHATGN